MKSEVKVYTPQELDAARERVKKREEELRNEGHAEGVKHGLRIGERYKGAAYAFVGFVAGCLFMGVYAASTNSNTMFTAGAVVDRVLARTVDTPTLPATPRVTPAEDYEQNTEDARQAACREGVRGACSRGP